MDIKSKIIDKEEALKNPKSKIGLDNIKSNYKLKQIFEYLPKRHCLRLIKCNKKIKNRLNINIKDYKNYCEIKIDVEIVRNKKKHKIYFLKDLLKEEEPFYHIYFNNSKEETKRNYLTEDDDINKINIIIDYKITSFDNLFANSDVKSINFKNFVRNNIKSMKGMFSGCSLLSEINLSNFNTEKVTDMSDMFRNCSLLKEINVTKFNTNNVIYFNGMFSGCNSLIKLNLSNFNTNNVTNMGGMFYGCSSLKELNISNFNTNNIANMEHMFFGCSKQLIIKMKSLNKFKEKVFK